MTNRKTKEDKTPETETPEPKLEVCGFPFYEDNLGPFNEGQMDAWARIQRWARHRRSPAPPASIRPKAQNLQAARVKAAQKAVEAIEKKLDAEHAKPFEKWDHAQIDKLTDALTEVTQRYLDVQGETADEFSERSVALAGELDEVAAIEQESHLAMAHHVASSLGCNEELEGWLLRAELRDYEAALELVRAGETPFLSRAARRRRQQAGIA